MDQGIAFDFDLKYINLNYKFILIKIRLDQ